MSANNGGTVSQNQAMRAVYRSDVNGDPGSWTAQVRQTDYAIADRLMEIAVRSIAVPVRNAAGKVVAGMNVIDEANRESLRDMRALYLPPLQAAAAELGAQIAP